MVAISFFLLFSIWLAEKAKSSSSGVAFLLAPTLVARVQASESPGTEGAEHPPVAAATAAGVRNSCMRTLSHFIAISKAYKMTRPEFVSAMAPSLKACSKSKTSSRVGEETTLP